MKRIYFTAILILLLFITGNAFAGVDAKGGYYYEIKVYHITNSRQEASIDSFLQYEYLPAMHAAKVSNIGVFKPIANDTAADKRIYVFTPYKSLSQWEKVRKETVDNFNAGSTGYTNVLYNNPAYVRMETILLKAFEKMQHAAVPNLMSAKAERVYELRSYEGASEKIFRNKVEMFNKGGETEIFSRLGFNPVFYAEVVFGAKMPNLMYMTSFENMKARDEHWKAFGNDPAWKKLSALPEYQNNVSHIDIVFVRPTNYSDL